MVVRVKLGFSFSNEMPGGAFGKCFAGAVPFRCTLVGLLDGHGVPVVFRIDVARSISLIPINDRGERRGNNHPLYCWCSLLDRLENPCRTNNYRFNQVLLDIIRVEVERRSSVNDCFERWVRNNSLIEGVFFATSSTIVKSSWSLPYLECACLTLLALS